MKKLLMVTAVLVIAFSIFIATSTKPVGTPAASKPPVSQASFKKQVKKVSVAKAEEIVVTEQVADKSVIIEDVGAQVSIGVAKPASVAITEAQFMALPKNKN